MQHLYTLTIPVKYLYIFTLHCTHNSPVMYLYGPSTPVQYLNLPEEFLFQVLVHGGRLRDIHRGHGVDVETENLGPTESHDKALSQKSLGYNPSNEVWDSKIIQTIGTCNKKLSALQIFFSHYLRTSNDNF